MNERETREQTRPPSGPRGAEDGVFLKAQGTGAAPGRGGRPCSRVHTRHSPGAGSEELIGTEDHLASRSFPFEEYRKRKPRKENNICNVTRGGICEALLPSGFGEKSLSRLGPEHVGTTIQDAQKLLRKGLRY